VRWYDEAWRVINEVDGSLPATATLDERKAALRAAYPFGLRQYHPYKQWCKAQRIYLARFDRRPITDGLFAKTETA
jgi:hypothetical protein